MKIQTKIALLFSGLVTIIIIVLSFVIYYITNQNLYEDFYKRLEIRAVIAAKAALEQDETNTSAFEEIRKEHLERLRFEKEYFFPVDSIRYLRSVTILTPGFFGDALKTGSARFKDGSTFYAGIFYTDNQGDYVVVVSAENELSGQLINRLRGTLIITLVAGILLSLAIGRFFFSKKILRPIREITTTVEDISAHNLHKRLETKKGQDEVALLTNTFNDMLDRLETAFETQNNFVSHASHELNTPLTAIIGEAEYSLSKPRENEQYVRSIKAIRHAAERLHNITKSLLQLAQTGFNGNVQSFKRMRIDELVYDVKKMVDSIIPENKVFINTSLLPENPRKLKLLGNRQLLELALANILLNACKYSDNKPVQVAIAATEMKVILIVKDEGIGIPEDEIKYIFDPFFRASNTQPFEGYGIGLPLTRNIIRLHKGEIVVQSKVNHGTDISIQFPIYQQEA
jgi:signal transduction histidine kinase